jgi:DNA-directed RNA polymerase specialized sigma24 family protein
MTRDTTSEFTDTELGTLDIAVRNILTAATCNGHSYHAVAEQFGVPVGTVKSRINRARAKIAAMRVKNLVHRASELASAPIGHPAAEVASS